MTYDNTTFPPRVDALKPGDLLLYEGKGFTVAISRSAGEAWHVRLISCSRATGEPQVVDSYLRSEAEPEELLKYTQRVV